MIAIDRLIRPGTSSSRLLRSHIFPLKRKWSEVKEYVGWILNGCPVPSPAIVKRYVFRRWSAPDAVWLETGTWLGDTTEFLAQNYSRVISLEPSFALFARAADRLSRHRNVELINKSSEEGFGPAVRQMRQNVSFWLDGHYSGNETFRGGEDSPLVVEIEEILKSSSNFNKIVVFIDDLRLLSNGFPFSSEIYPCRNEVIRRMVENGFKWHVEHDIIIFSR